MRERFTALPGEGSQAVGKEPDKLSASIQMGWGVFVVKRL